MPYFGALTLSYEGNSAQSEKKNGSSQRQQIQGASFCVLLGAYSEERGTWAGKHALVRDILVGILMLRIVSV